MALGLQNIAVWVVGVSFWLLLQVLLIPTAINHPVVGILVASGA